MKLRRPRRTIIVAVAIAAAIGAGAAFAGGGILGGDGEAFFDDVAERAGVTPEKLRAAVEGALKARVDEALADGRITKEQADRLREAIESAPSGLGLGLGPLGGGRGLGHAFGHGFGFGHGPGHGLFGIVGKLEAAASYLGLTEAELRSQLSDGKSLAEIAKAKGKSVDGLVDALVADAKKRLDQAVEDKRLTAEQRTELLSGLVERVRALVQREPALPHLWTRPGASVLPARSAQAGTV
jgi:hypothetical protein